MSVTPMARKSSSPIAHGQVPVRFRRKARRTAARSRRIVRGTDAVGIRATVDGAAAGSRTSERWRKPRIPNAVELRGGTWVRRARHLLRRELRRRKTGAGRSPARTRREEAERRRKSTGRSRRSIRRDLTAKKSVSSGREKRKPIAASGSVCERTRAKLTANHERARNRLPTPGRFRSYTDWPRPSDATRDAANSRNSDECFGSGADHARSIDTRWTAALMSRTSGLA